MQLTDGASSRNQNMPFGLRGLPASATEGLLPKSQGVNAVLCKSAISFLAEGGFDFPSPLFGEAGEDGIGEAGVAANRYFVGVCSCHGVVVGVRMRSPPITARVNWSAIRWISAGVKSDGSPPIVTPPDVRVRGRGRVRCPVAGSMKVRCAVMGGVAGALKIPPYAARMHRLRGSGRQRARLVRPGSGLRRRGVSGSWWD
jgi:hypothetical protein